jgi:hypothetical protein
MMVPVIPLLQLQDYDCETAGGSKNKKLQAPSFINVPGVYCNLRAKRTITENSDTGFLGDSMALLRHKTVSI